MLVPAETTDSDDHRSSARSPSVRPDGQATGPPMVRTRDRLYYGWRLLEQRRLSTPRFMCTTSPDVEVPLVLSLVAEVHQPQHRDRFADLPDRLRPDGEDDSRGEAQALVVHRSSVATIRKPIKPRPMAEIEGLRLRSVQVHRVPYMWLWNTVAGVRLALSH